MLIKRAFKRFVFDWLPVIAFGVWYGWIAAQGSGQ
jgi:hypothetical protein